ncbi:MAG: Crp/Fnr family transcriptional regulator [Nitrospinae bacterium]|nr:Crp/Fnr family transcriptional regulator [Nitrospinota bacterium]MBI3814062.1 Crp/Fnr family transcriptional regulator [Nitrospinota bacterium]
MKPLSLQLLKKITFFTDLSDKEIEQIAALIRYQRYRKQEVIFHADDPGSSLFVLKSGTVKISITDRKGGEVILKLLNSGDFFGEMALLDGQHRSATVTALEDTEAIIMERESFLNLIDRHPRLLLKICLNICRRLRQTDEKIKNLIFADAYGKVAQTLCKLVEERGEQVADGILLKVPLSREELAHMAGVTRQTLSMVLGDYQRAGVLRKDKHRILIIDEVRLRRETLL